MTNAMTFRGYSAQINRDCVDGIFSGRIAGIGDVAGFHANTIEGLRAAFEEAVDDYIETCALIGKDPQKA